MNRIVNAASCISIFVVNISCFVHQLLRGRKSLLRASAFSEKETFVVKHLREDINQLRGIIFWFDNWLY